MKAMTLSISCVLTIWHNRCVASQTVKAVPVMPGVLATSLKDGAVEEAPAKFPFGQSHGTLHRPA